MIEKRRDTSKKRDSILDAAIKAFQRQGYESTSMDTIAEVANASKRTVYNHFPSKEALFREMLTRIFDKMIELKDIKYSHLRSLEDQLGDFAEAKRTFSTDPTLLGTTRVCMGVFISQPKLAVEAMKKAASMDNSLALWLKAATKDKKLKVKDPKLASEIFWSMMSGTFFWPAIIEGPMEKRRAQRLKKELIATFLARYRL